MGMVANLCRVLIFIPVLRIVTIMRQLNLSFVSLFVAIIFCQSTHAQSLDANFDGSTGLLTIPAVTVDQQSFEIDMSVYDAATLDFVITRAEDRALTVDPRAGAFSLTDNILKLPVVNVGAEAYSVSFQLVSDNPVIFRITGANLVNGACEIPALPETPPVAAATQYSEVQTNTSTKDEFAGVRTIVADFNHDGRDDLFWMALSFNDDVSEAFNTPRVWLSTGDNGFSDATTTYLPDGIGLDTPRQIFEGDFDGDSITDFLVLQHGYDPGGLQGKGCENVVCPGAANLLLMQDANGALRDNAAQALNPFDSDGFTHSGGVADVDCDGDLDILEGQLRNEIATGANHIQLNDGNGVFTASEIALPESIRDFGMYGAALCDFDRDGDPDLYISSLGIPEGLDSADKLLVNDGFGRFSLQQGRPAPESPVGDLQQRAADMRCLDYNNDGYNDILKPNEADNSFLAFELLHNNGDLTFSNVTAEKLQQTATAGGAYTAKLVDLNQDGWIDLLAQGTGDSMRIYWNTGDGFDEYRVPAGTAINTSGASLSPGDFDGDGDLDIHVSRSHFESFILKAQ